MLVCTNQVVRIVAQSPLATYNIWYSVVDFQYDHLNPVFSHCIPSFSWWKSNYVWLLEKHYSLLSLNFYTLIGYSTPCNDLISLNNVEIKFLLIIYSNIVIHGCCLNDFTIQLQMWGLRPCIRWWMKDSSVLSSLFLMKTNLQRSVDNSQWTYLT